MELSIEQINPILDFIKQSMNQSTMKVNSSAGKADFFTGRLIAAASQPNLLAVLNRYQEIINSPTPHNIDNLIAVCASESAPTILAWIREQPKIIIALAYAENDTREQAIKAYQPTISRFKPIQKRPAFDINIKAYVLQALSHGDDVKAGNNMMFRRGDVGGGVRLPFYSANAIGHGLRQGLAEHMLKALGFKIDKAAPQYEVWFHHFLYSGGIMVDGAIPKEFIAKLQGAGAGGVKSEGIRELRDTIPFFSMLGGVAKSPLEGYVYIYDLRPECVEWGNGDIPVHELFDWRFFVRHDQYEGRINKATAKETDSDAGNISLPVNVEVLKEGAYLEGGINLSHHIQPIEIACLYRGLKILQEKGRFGGKRHRGHGLLQIDLTDKDGKPLKLSEAKYYDLFLDDNYSRIRQYIEKIGAYTADVFNV